MDKAILGVYFFDVPVRKNVIGKMEDVPIPTRENPIIAGQKAGKITAMIIPVAIKIELKKYMDFIPIILMIKSEMNRENAMQLMKTRYPAVKISTFMTSLKYIPLQSNMPPSQIAAKRTMMPKRRICLSGFLRLNLFPVGDLSPVIRYFDVKIVEIIAIDPMIKKWISIPIPNVTKRVESPTPDIPPKLHSPWKEPLIPLSYCFCKVSAWAFAAMFCILIKKAKTNMKIINVNILWDKPMANKEMLCMIMDIISGQRVSNFDASQPDIGNPST